MNKNISLLTLSLFLYLSACSTETNTGSTSTTEQPKVKTASIQQEEIKKIELISTKVKNKKAVINLEFDKIIKSMEHTGIDKDRERVIPLLLDDEAKANIDYQMNVNYQDGSSETYLIWLEDKKVVIARQDNEEQKNLEHYIIRDTDAQQILRLFKNNVE